MRTLLKNVLFITLSVMLLSACGGGGGGGGTPPEEPAPAPPKVNTNWDEISWDKDNWS